VTVSTQWK
jgi:hypothetical protein